MTPSNLSEDSRALLALMREAFEESERRREEATDERVNRFIEGFAGAFPRDADGKPDFRGHRNAHEREIEQRRRCASFWERAVSSAVIFILGAGGLFSASAIWSAVKKVITNDH